MKTLIAILIVLSSFSAFAAETESRCGQVDDSVDRTTTEVGPAQEAPATGSGAATGV